MAWQNGQKAGFCILWSGTKKVGDDFTPETYELSVTFGILDYSTGRSSLSSNENIWCKLQL